jgi:hypothetical protein
VAASTDEALERALAPIRRLGRVGQILVLGVTE